MLKISNIQTPNFKLFIVCALLARRFVWHGRGCSARHVANLSRYEPVPIRSFSGVFQKLFAVLCVLTSVFCVLSLSAPAHASIENSSSQAVSRSAAGTESSISSQNITGDSQPISPEPAAISQETVRSEDPAISSDESADADNAAEKSPETRLAQAETSTDEETSNEETTAQSASVSAVSTEEITPPTASSGGPFSSVQMVPQVNTGTAATGIPIEVPPGRKDMAPRLSLNYSSSQSNGWLGVGWMLDLGAIQRETKWGVNYGVNDYVFVINSSRSELVFRADWGFNYYGAKIEGEFSKYYHNNITGGWEVTAKNGTKYYFGSASASRQYDPDNANAIFKWSLDRVEDTNGNYMEIYYQKYDNEIYLDEIKYTGSAAGLTPANSVKFYLEPRTDAYEVYTTRFPVKTAYRLKTIEVYGNGELARTYELTYTYSPGTNRSLLASVTLYGSDGNPLPPVSFTYSEMDLGFNGTAIQWYTLQDLATQQVRRDGCTLQICIFNDIFDMNGDAMPDRISSSVAGQSGIGSYLNSGNGFSDEAQMTGLSSAIRNTYTNGTSEDFADINGDGLPDRVTRGGVDYLNVYLNTGNGFDYVTEWYTPVVNSNWDQYVRNSDSDTGSVYQDIIDMNGDGLPDRVTSNPDRSSADYLLVYLNTGAGFSDRAGTWTTPIVNSNWKQDVISAGSNGSVYQSIMDMNGDGLPDRVTSNPGRSSADYLLVYLNTGAGFSDTAIAWHTPIVNSNWKQDVINANSNGTYQGIKDMNGDGLPDRITRGGADYLNVYLNTGSGFSETAITWHTPVTNSDWSQFVVNEEIGIIDQNILDINGDGLPDRVTSPASKQGDYLQVYPSDGPFPDLLTNIDNGLGGTTEIQYTPSTQYDNTYLPFVQQTVSSVTVKDGKGSSSTTTFEYSGGYYSIDEKEFRGFEYVKSTAPNGTVTETWFKQDDIFKGLMEDQIIKDPSDNIYTWIENTYESTAPYTGVDYPYLAQKNDYIYDGDNSSDPRHIINSFTYDDFGNVTSKYYGEDPLKGDERIEYTQYYYDTANWIVSLPSTKYVIDSSAAIKAQIWYTYYDNTVNLWTKTGWLSGGTNPVTTYTYDAYGNVKTVTDPENNPPTVITYDSATHTYPVTMQNPAGNAVQMTYNMKYGKLWTSTDHNGNTITYDYDEFGRLVKVTNPSPYGITEYLYQNYGDPYNQKVREEAKDRYGTLILFKETYFDGLGRTTSERQGGPAAATIIADTEYNNKGLAYKKSLPYYSGDPVYKTTYTYDPVDRLIQTLNPDGTSSSIGYERGRITYIDANRHKKVAEKDIYERIVKIEEHSGEYPSNTLYAETTYSYDALGNLTYVRDEYGNETIITYDTLSRKISMDDPDMGYWEYDYDANGNLTYQKDAKLQEITFEYDELDRVIKKIYPDAAFIEYKYDEAFSTNSTGRLTTLMDLSGTTKHYYDALGQIIKTVKTIDTSTYTTQTQYDALGRVEKVIYPDSSEVDYTYDGNGNIQEISSGPQTYVTYNGYTAMGNPLFITYGNLVTTQYQFYPENNRLFSITTNSQTTGLMNITYYYDNIGNITKIEDLLDSNKTRDYIYDDFDRLIEADSPSYGGNLVYQYDKIGNMTYNCRYGYYEYDSDHPHAVKRIVKNQQVIEQYEYDANGNMISGAGRTFTYDYDNMPTSIVYNLAATISVYDAYGMRAKKVTPASTTKYVGQIYECEDGECTKYVFAGIQRIATIKSTDTYYSHTDHLGSATVLTDSSSNVAQDIYYYPYGEIKTSTGSIDVRHKYTDKEWDAETGLYYFGARYYDPKLAKFISADTIVPLPFYPQTFNRYAYTYNNPIIFRDLDGHCSFLPPGSPGYTPPSPTLPPQQGSVLIAQNNSTTGTVINKGNVENSQPKTQPNEPNTPSTGAFTGDSGGGGQQQESPGSENSSMGSEVSITEWFTRIFEGSEKGAGVGVGGELKFLGIKLKFNISDLQIDKLTRDGTESYSQEKVGLSGEAFGASGSLESVNGEINKGFDYKGLSIKNLTTVELGGTFPSPFGAAAHGRLTIHLDQMLYFGVSQMRFLGGEDF